MRKSCVLSVLLGGVFLASAIGPPCGAQGQPCEDSVFALVHDDTIIVHHAGAFYNCCATIEYAIAVVGDTIDLIEEETFELGPCDCLCCFDLSTDITGLVPGTYLVRVWGYEYSDPELVLFGQVWVTVGGSGHGVAIASLTQSECYGEDFPCGDCNGDERISIADATYVISHIYRGGTSPLGQADVNSDGRVTVGDATYIVAYLYRRGSAPCSPGTQVPFEDVAQHDCFDVTERGTGVIRSESEWRNLWKDYWGCYDGSGNRTPPPEIDFDDEMVIAVFWGDNCAYSGCTNKSPSIQRVSIVRDTLEVVVGDLADLGPCCACVCPLHLIHLQRYDLPVKFVGNVP